jgi:hypothetical protein
MENALERMFLALSLLLGTLSLPLCNLGPSGQLPFCAAKSHHTSESCQQPHKKVKQMGKCKRQSLPIASISTIISSN